MINKREERRAEVRDLGVWKKRDLFTCFTVKNSKQEL